MALLVARCDDGDGLLRLRELHACAEAARLGLATKDTTVAMEEMDLNGDGHVSFRELHMAGEEPLEELEEERLEEEQRLFEAADDGDGRLDAKELRALLYPETREAYKRQPPSD